MAEKIRELALESLRAKGMADAAALSERAVSGEADGTCLIGCEMEIPTWRQRAYNTEETPVGKPYRWKGQVYQLLQQHDATQQLDWTPDQAVSLWDICHTTEPAEAKEYTAPQGSRGLWQVGECCVFNDCVWKNTAADNAYSPAELPERWEKLGTVSDVQGV